MSFLPRFGVWCLGEKELFLCLPLLEGPGERVEGGSLGGGVWGGRVGASAPTLDGGFGELKVNSTGSRRVNLHKCTHTHTIFFCFGVLFHLQQH